MYPSLDKHSDKPHFTQLNLEKHYDGRLQKSGRSETKFYGSREEGNAHAVLHNITCVMDTLLFMDDITADANNKSKAEVYIHILSSQTNPNTTPLNLQLPE